MSVSVKILGLDPGLRCAGWGLISARQGKLTFLGSGAIKPDPKQSLAYRLASLANQLAELIEQAKPDVAAVEETFVNVNPKSALMLGQARGVCLAAPAIAGLPVSEYPANTIKKSVVGVGHAGKQQVQSMIRVLLPLAGDRPSDEADALAVAICHAHHGALETRIGKLSA